MDAVLFALTPLPVEGQMALLRMDAPDVHTTLATSPHLDPAAAKVIHDKSVVAPSAVWYAIRSLDDPDMLASYVDRGSAARAAAAARNPRTPPAALVSALNSANPDVRISALMNPASPIEARQAVASPDLLASLVNVGSNLADSVVRAGELVLSNPWIGESPGRYDKLLHRAIASSPHFSADVVSSLSKFSRSGRIFVKRHPLLLEPGSTWESFNTEELAGFAHPAADLAALARPDLGLELAASMLSRTNHPMEPQVVPRFLQRFGLAAAASYEKDQFSGSRIGAAAWSHPVASHLARWSDEVSTRYAAYAGILADLGSDRSTWDMVCPMLQKWSLEPAKLVSTVARLSNPAR